jgi:two-component system response regulator AtoC
MTPYKVLTVDIAPPSNALADLVNTMGFRGYGVERKADLLPAFRRLNPDLLLVGPGVPTEQIGAYASIVDKEKRGLPILCLSKGETRCKQAGTLPDEVNLAFLPETFQPADLRATIERLLTGAKRTDESDLRELDNLIVGKTPAMEALKRHILQVCKSDLTVLISGESGTGKEVVARAIHRFSARAACPFIKVNSAGLPRDLFESELFGYEKGAFTGACRNKPGKFDLAHMGTILLDEIGEIPLPLQAKLLHVLEDREFSPLGSTKNTRIDTRVLAATNANLDQMVLQGRFRLDLFYRLNVVSIRIPPLRERQDDVDLLCDYFETKHAPRCGQTLHPLADRVRERFRQYPWPGNVRQLENAVRSIIAVGNADGVLPKKSDRMRTYTLKEFCREASHGAQKKAIEDVLVHTGWNRKEAAKALKTSYRNLLNKISEYHIVETTPVFHYPGGA